MDMAFRRLLQSSFISWAVLNFWKAVLCFPASESPHHHLTVLIPKPSPFIRRSTDHLLPSACLYPIGWFLITQDLILLTNLSSSIPFSLCNFLIQMGLLDTSRERPFLRTMSASYTFSPWKLCVRVTFADLWKEYVGGYLPTSWKLACMPNNIKLFCIC